MELKIELKNIESQFIEDGKIITNENGKKIEYIIKNNVIVEVNPYDENRIAEEKINELLGNNEGIKKINTIMRMQDKCNSNDPYYSINTLNYEVAAPTKNTDVDMVKGIINLEKNGVLDEIATKNRGKIADNLKEDKESEETDEIDRNAKIATLKKMLEKLESETKE